MLNDPLSKTLRRLRAQHMPSIERLEGEALARRVNNQLVDSALKSLRGSGPGLR